MLNRTMNIMAIIAGAIIVFMFYFIPFLLKLSAAINPLAH